MNRPAAALLGLLSGLLLLASGCQTFSIATPADFVERPEPEWSSYAYRALSADAVVLVVREIDEDADSDEGAFASRKDVSLAFWLRAVKNRLQASQAYALLAEEELVAASGERGTLLRLAREDGGVQHDYWVGLIDAGQYLYVLEAGGRREAFAPLEESLRGSFKSFRVE